MCAFTAVRKAARFKAHCSPFPLADIFCSHPRNKTEVARRLAAAVLHDQFALQWPAGGFPSATPVNWRGPVVTSAAYADATRIRVTFATVDGAAVYLADTAGCWECCARAQDTVQVATSPAGPWVNATVALDGTSALLVTPTSTGAYAQLRYAPHTWPQCVVYSSSNLMPAPPALLNVSSLAAANPASLESVSSARGRLLAQRKALIPLAVPSPRTWREWRGQSIPPPMAAGSVGSLLATPPAGMNSWNAFHTNVDEVVLQRTADALVSLGLAALGYDYVNIDDVSVDCCYSSSVQQHIPHFFQLLRSTLPGPSV
jgi:hypothetical protein